MKTDKLTRLISALGKPSYQARPEQQKVAEEKAVADTDAVKISSTLAGKDGDAVERTPRQRKVAAIKAQIEAGAYNVASEEIAGALIREFSL